MEHSFVDGGAPSDTAMRLMSAAYGGALADTATRRRKRPRRLELGQSVGKKMPARLHSDGDDAFGTRAIAMTSAQRNRESISKAELFQLKAVGQVERCFIAARTLGNGIEGTKLFFVDQHAADERVQLERLHASTIAANGLPVSGVLGHKELRPPQQVRLSPHERILLEGYLARVVAWGWNLKACPQQDEAMLLSIPSLLGVELSSAGAIEYLHVLHESQGGSTQPPPVVLRLLASKACRSAIMFGDIISLTDCQTLLHELSRCELPFQCAHGRPTIAPVLRLHPGGVSRSERMRT